MPKGVCMRQRICLSCVVTVLTIVASLNAQWVRTGGPGAATYCLAARDTFVFAATDRGLFVSTNKGATWSAGGIGSNYSVNALLANGTNLFAGALRWGVFLSTNNGQDFANSGQMNQNVYSLGALGADLFAGTDAGIYYSTDNGSSWTLTSAQWSFQTKALVAAGTNIVAGTGAGIFVSSDFVGKHWINMLLGVSVTSLAVMGSDVFAGCTVGVYKGTGSTSGAWSDINANLGVVGETWVNCLAVSGRNLFAGTNAGGVYLLADGQTDWKSISKNAGLLTFRGVTCLLVAGANIYAATPDYGVYRRALAEVVTSVNHTASEVPARFSLDQNYPNPFNPSTIISFGVANNAFITLKVFDALGREVSTLVSEELAAGTYSRHWDAANVASGVYFYRLQVGEFVGTKKMVLLR
jgi:hypothetical protein